MIRMLKLFLAGLLFASTFGVAHAQSGSWIVSEVSGHVTVRDGGNVEMVSRGATVSPGAIVETGPVSRAVIVRRKDFVTVAPNSRIRIPAAKTQQESLFDVLQEWGNVIFQIEKKPDPHFSVGTPYLAAVVKGTTFSITVSEGGSSLQVTEGAVEASTMDGGARDLIRPGIVAVVSATDRYRLTVQGQDTKIIDSPRRPAAESTAPETESSSVDQQSSSEQTSGPEGAGGAGDGPQIELSSGVFAETPSLGTQLIVEPVASDPVNLAQVTGGLLAGTTANQVSSVQGASARDAARNSSAGDGLGQGSGNNPGIGNDSGSGAAAGNGNGSGNGAAVGSGAGNGNGASNGNGGGNGNAAGNGNGSGNAAVVGNGAGNGNGASNGNGGGNGNAAGNGNGLGNGVAAGNGAGNGNGASNGNGIANAGGNGSGNGLGSGNAQVGIAAPPARPAR